MRKTPSKIVCILDVNRLRGIDPSIEEGYAYGSFLMRSNPKPKRTFAGLKVRLVGVCARSAYEVVSLPRNALDVPSLQSPPDTMDDSSQRSRNGEEILDIARSSKDIRWLFVRL